MVHWEREARAERQRLNFLREVSSPSLRNPASSPRSEEAPRVKSVFAETTRVNPATA